MASYQPPPLPLRARPPRRWLVFAMAVVHMIAPPALMLLADYRRSQFLWDVVLSLCISQPLLIALWAVLGNATGKNLLTGSTVILTYWLILNGFLREGYPLGPAISASLVFCLLILPCRLLGFSIVPGGVLPRPRWSIRDWMGRTFQLALLLAFLPVCPLDLSIVVLSVLLILGCILVPLGTRHPVLSSLVVMPTAIAAAAYLEILHFSEMDQSILVPLLLSPVLATLLVVRLAGYQLGGPESEADYEPLYLSGNTCEQEKRLTAWPIPPL